ncbi:hypothetical protein Y032_0286g1408 [Ancylostoma ceylanicum]|uniref:Uncharacterized protein n=1 Tax=Ancylostoma ceylanicum TaxID=53326 RepID=A0A016S602_9BILA|nr:hypothetical protein Y032_0286g1408 [Ancylostoma ceylanicum]
MGSTQYLSATGAWFSKGSYGKFDFGEKLHNLETSKVGLGNSVVLGKLGIKDKAEKNSFIAQLHRVNRADQQKRYDRHDHTILLRDNPGSIVKCHGGELNSKATTTRKVLVCKLGAILVISTSTNPTLGSFARFEDETHLFHLRHTYCNPPSLVLLYDVVVVSMISVR